MAIEVKIQRKLNTFELNIDFKSDSWSFSFAE